MSAIQPPPFWIHCFLERGFDEILKTVFNFCLCRLMATAHTWTVGEEDPLRAINTILALSRWFLPEPTSHLKRTCVCAQVCVFLYVSVCMLHIMQHLVRLCYWEEQKPSRSWKFVPPSLMLITLIHHYHSPSLFSQIINVLENKYFPLKTIQLPYNEV